VAEKKSTLVMPLPVEVLRFFDHGLLPEPETEKPAATTR
jgi:hypothetical protein